METNFLEDNYNSVPTCLALQQPIQQLHALYMMELKIPKANMLFFSFRSGMN